MRWRPIPIALGACVLVAIQAHRTWKREKERYIDENGQPVELNFQTGQWADGWTPEGADSGPQSPGEEPGDSRPVRADQH